MNVCGMNIHTRNLGGSTIALIGVGIGAPIVAKQQLTIFASDGCSPAPEILSKIRTSALHNPRWSVALIRSVIKTTAMVSNTSSVMGPFQAIGSSPIQRYRRTIMDLFANSASTSVTTGIQAAAKWPQIHTAVKATSLSGGEDFRGPPITLSIAAQVVLRPSRSVHMRYAIRRVG